MNAATFGLSLLQPSAFQWREDGLSRALRVEGNLKKSISEANDVLGNIVDFRYLA